MDATRWRELSAWLDQLLELESGPRQHRLQQIGARDPGLQQQLQRLLEGEPGAEQFMAQPVWSAPARSRADSQVGPYRLLRLLGEGGMGEVWLAERCDGLYDRQVALKLLRSGLADTGLHARFARERQILARLQHPHLAQLLDAGIDTEGHPYFVLDHVRGEPITHYCQRLNLPLEQRLQLMLQVCAVVAHAHTNLVVHRDLKPCNILVEHDGTVKLLDFGIAHRLGAEPVGGNGSNEARAFTLHYAAPEQVCGEAVTTLTDVYSLGVVLYEMVTDRKPYRLRRQSDGEWERAVHQVQVPLASQMVLRGEPDTPAAARAQRRRARQLRGDFDQLLACAMQKDPARRYSSVDALAADLRRFLQQRPLQAHAPQLSYRFGKYLQRHRWGVLAASFAVVALLGVSTTAVRQAHQSRQEMVRRQAMQDFIVGLFDRAASTRTGRIDVRSLLDAGQQRGDVELAAQPLALAELHGVIGRLRIGLGDYQAALATLDKQQALLRTLPQVPAEASLDAATQRARALRMLGRDGDCVRELLPLREQAQGGQALPPLLVAEFDSQLGRCQAQLGERVQARAAFQRALALRGSAAAGPLAAAESLADLAGLDVQDGRVQAALEGYPRALALLDHAHSGQTAQAIQLRRQLGMLLAERGQGEAADATLEHAWQDAVAAFGPGHPESLVVRRDRALLALDDGRLAWAGQELQQVDQALVAVLGHSHREVGHAEHALGLWARASGDVAQAAAHFANAVRIWSAPDHIALLPQALVDLGLAERDRGRPAAARQAWQRARSLMAAQRGEQAAQVKALDTWIAALPTAAERSTGIAAAN